jgi:uncharacterized protein (DUF1499 family)
MKKVLITIAILIVAQIIAIFIIGRTFYPDNIAQTSPDGGQKDLRTRFYTTDLDTAKKTVKEVIPTLTTYDGAWKIIDESDDGKITKIKVEVPVLIFTDDLEVNIKKADNLHEVRIDMISKSRVGKSDFGENARHIRQLLEALDAKLGKN